MSIIITNISDVFDETGVNEYVLRINDKVIGEFHHIRSEGLAVCLCKAALCALNKEKEEENVKTNFIG